MIRSAALALSLLLAAPALAQTQAAAASAAPPPAPDYASPAAWACRPEAPGACGGDLGAMAVANDGTRTPDPFAPAADPPVDCFYVYPTTSAQEADYATAEREPAVDHTVHLQAARLASRCRVYAPLYRQLTSAGLNRALAAHPDNDLNWDLPYQDVRAAWRRYLAHDNHGRGVVLVGHSQGSILLARLLAEEIEGSPAHRLLVSAVLAGHPAVLTPKGADVGGTFKSTPLCHAKAQSGCVVVWSSYPATAPDGETRVFARDQRGMVAACVNPAAPQGGPAPLRPALARPSIAPAADPPFVEPVGQLTGACEPDGGGTVLKVTVLPGRYAELMTTMLSRVGRSPAWGLHGLDVGLVEDDVSDLIAAQSAAWTAAKR